MISTPWALGFGAPADCRLESDRPPCSGRLTLPPPPPQLTGHRPGAGLLPHPEPCARSTVQHAQWDLLKITSEDATHTPPWPLRANKRHTRPLQVPVNTRSLHTKSTSCRRQRTYQWCRACSQPGLSLPCRRDRIRLRLNGTDLPAHLILLLPAYESLDHIHTRPQKPERYKRQ